MKITRKLAGAGAAVALTAATLGVTAGPAQAAAYNGACGSGYRVIDKLKVGGTVEGTGTAYLTYNNGWNCVVTVTNTPGTRDWMTASIKLSSSSQWNDDEGYYTQYAGPRYVYAPDQCIDWGGSVDYKGLVWLEWNDHCG
ncbi:spore-associated protein A [Actinoplanes sp. NPDC049316]|uniref:spore-associated protein A n=1 Tax=Actinoplanes sp. NPDC049316 TaxID=3154727 RepID=UPI003444C61F